MVEAARFAKANASVKGDHLDTALKQQTWDDSVKALVSFPQALTMMNDKLDWTQKLGDAFLGQQEDLMDAVPRLRAKAQAGEARMAHRSPRQRRLEPYSRTILGQLCEWVHDRIDINLGICQNPEDLPESRQMML